MNESGRKTKNEYFARQEKRFRTNEGKRENKHERRRTNGGDNERERS